MHLDPDELPDRDLTVDPAPWIADPAGWHALDDEAPLEVACPVCARPHGLGQCPYCGSLAVPPEPATSTHGQLCLEIARLRTAIGQAIADLEANMACGFDGVGATHALQGLKRAMKEGQP